MMKTATKLMKTKRERKVKKTKRATMKHPFLMLPTTRVKNTTVPKRPCGTIPTWSMNRHLATDP
jgi:hypothetical protein